MVTLKRNTSSVYTTEAKQIGSLYHVTTLEGVSNYIAPTDTLSGSGKYRNYLLGGETNVVSFTRDKSFVVSTRVTRIANLLFDFEVDGDRLSEKYKITPYNDFAYDVFSGKVKKDAIDPKHLEHEEVVVGKIHPFSKYVKSVRFCFAIESIDDVIEVNDELKKCKEYLAQFNIKSDIKLRNKLISELKPVSFPSFDVFVEKMGLITKILENRDTDERVIDDAFKEFPLYVLDDLSQVELKSSDPDSSILHILDIAIKKKGGKGIYSSISELTFSKLEDAIGKKKLKDKFEDVFINSRLESFGKDSYSSLSTKGKLDLIWKYSNFNKDQIFKIYDIAKKWYKEHPKDVDCGPYGMLEEKDFSDTLNIYKVLNYLYINYDKSKIDTLLFDLISMDGKDIALSEFLRMNNPDIYTLGVSKLSGDDLFEYLTTWTDIFSEKRTFKHNRKGCIGYG